MKILKNNRQVEKLMLEALAREGRYALKNASRRLKRKIKNIVYDAINDCPEIEELSRYDGKLRLDFGLTSDPTPEIINGIVDSVFVEVRRMTAVGNRLRGGITIGVQPVTAYNLFSIPEAEQEIESGGYIPWLQWLLFEGDKVIIQDYGVEYKIGVGRTGQARMIEEAPPFRVDPRYSGTIESNFITRALYPFIPAINQTIKQEFTR
jgi:hypothetical protein